jgi:hypothetical protein
VKKYGLRIDKIIIAFADHIYNEDINDLSEGDKRNF